jgi:hypothetical protein
MRRLSDTSRTNCLASEATRGFVPPGELDIVVASMVRLTCFDGLRRRLLAGGVKHHMDDAVSAICLMRNATVAVRTTAVWSGEIPIIYDR